MALVRMAADAEGRAAVAKASGVRRLCKLFRINAEHVCAEPRRATTRSWHAAAVIDTRRALANVARNAAALRSMQKASVISDVVPLLDSSNPAMVAAACAVVRGYAMRDGYERIGMWWQQEAQQH